MIKYFAIKLGLYFLMLLITANGLAAIFSFFTGFKKDAWLLGFAVACGIAFITWQIWFMLKYVIGG